MLLKEKQRGIKTPNNPTQKGIKAHAHGVWDMLLQPEEPTPDLQPLPNVVG